MGSYLEAYALKKCIFTEGIVTFLKKNNFVRVPLMKQNENVSFIMGRKLSVLIDSR